MHSPPPRPILKTSPPLTLTTTTPLPVPSRAPVSHSLHVHFPPTPTMTQTEITHSSRSYDRKPIVVLPNACALPERGERAMDSSFPDSEHYDLELWAFVDRKRKGGYFHPRAYETSLESEAAPAAGETDLLVEQFSSSLLFARDPSSLSSPYHVQNHTLHHTQSHFRPSIHVGTVDVLSDAASDPSTTTGRNLLHHGPMDPCHFIQNLPYMDLSLPFLQPKQKMRDKKEIPSATSKKRSTTSLSDVRTAAAAASTKNNNLERARKVVRNAGCGGFNSGLYDSGLDGCLGGF